MALEIVTFDAEHVYGAATLLAQRQRADRAREPLLAALYEEPTATLPLVKELAERADGVVAINDGCMVGYLMGVSVAAAAGRQVNVPIAGHAIDSAYNGLDVYGEMYAAQSQRWIAGGFFDHYLAYVSSDPVARDAWFNLGFGNDMVFVSRSTDAFPTSSQPPDVRRAGPDDAKIIHSHVVNGIFRYNATPPLYRPYTGYSPPEDAAWIEVQRHRLEDPQHGYFIVYEGGRPVGVMLFTPPEPDNALISPPDSVHLLIAYLRPSARDGGLGSRFLTHCFEWARAQGYKHCTLRYFSANLVGSRFWRGKGFQPLAHRVCRHLDERLAWAHAAEEDEVQVLAGADV